MRSAVVGAGIATIVGAVLLTGIVALLTLPPATGPPTGPASVEVTLYGGELADKFGFGLEIGALSSPGPTLKLKVGDVVRIRFKNVGEIQHAFWVVPALGQEARPLWGAEIGSATRPLRPGQEGVITFKVEKLGNQKVFYVCPVPGHALRGMFGEIDIVTQG